MLRITIRLLLMLTVAATLAIITSCGAAPMGDGEDGDDKGNGEKQPVAIRIPSSDTFGRDVVKFDSIVYSRPDTDVLIAGLLAARDGIIDNSIPYDEQLGAVIELEDEYTDFLTMYAYANIQNYRNSADEVYSAEFAHLSEKYAEIVDAIEELMVAAAGSPHAESFESEYFGEGLIEKYSDGESLSDKVVALMKAEAELEARYTATKHGKLAEMKEIYLELLRVRRMIADEMGYDSYRDYAYEQNGYSYASSEVLDLITEISKYAAPVYQKLSKRVFTNYFKKNTAAELDTGVLVNTLADVYEGLDEDFADVYSYMLHFGLFDISNAEEGRFAGAFTTYLNGYESPYLFVTSNGTMADYLTLSHEFGHFTDFFKNGDTDVQLDLTEVYSQSMTMLTLLALEERMSAKDYQYLFYTQLEEMLLTLVFQGYYARFEHIVYELEYGDISEVNVNRAAMQAAAEMSLPSYYYGTMNALMIPHLFVQPFYVESYCTSLTAAMQIFFAEYENDGDGLTLYNALLDREHGSSLTENLERVNMDSPFKSGLIYEMVDKIHYLVLGAPYFDESANDSVYLDPRMICSPQKSAA